MISWSAVALKAIEAGVSYTEMTMCGNLVGFEIGGHVVRPVNGWYNQVAVVEAVEAAKLRVAA